MCVRVCLFAMVRGMLWKSDKPSIISSSTGSSSSSSTGSSSSIRSTGSSSRSERPFTIVIREQLGGG